MKIKERVDYSMNELFNVLSKVCKDYNELPYNIDRENKLNLIVHEERYTDTNIKESFYCLKFNRLTKCLLNDVDLVSVASWNGRPVICSDFNDFYETYSDFSCDLMFDNNDELFNPLITLSFYHKDNLVFEDYVSDFDLDMESSTEDDACNYPCLSLSISDNVLYVKYPCKEDYWQNDYSYIVKSYCLMDENQMRFQV